MKECKECHIIVDSFERYCPLCHQVLQIDEEKKRLYPEYHYKTLDYTRSFTFRLWLFLSFVIGVFSLFINLLTYHRASVLWFLFVWFGILYLWLLIANTILSKMSLGGKIFLQVIGISVLLFLIDINSGFYRWSLNIVIPFLTIFATLFITIIVSHRRVYWTEYIGYGLCIICLGFFPLILSIFRVTTMLWPSMVAAIYSFITLAGMFLFARQRFSVEIKQRFHW